MKIHGNPTGSTFSLKQTKSSRTLTNDLLLKNFVIFVSYALSKNSDIAVQLPTLAITDYKIKNINEFCKIKS